MNITIYYLYSANNAGDMAICLGLLDLLSELNDLKIKFVSRFAEKDPEFSESKKFINSYFPEVEVAPGYIRFSRSSNFINKLISYFKGFALSIFPFLNKNMKRDLENADLVLLNGGNFLRCNSVTDLLRLKAMFIPFKLARRKNKHMICMPQSTSFCEKTFYEKKIKKYLSLFDYVFVREKESYEYFINKHLVDSEKTFLTCDLAFFTRNDFKKISVDNNYNKRIALNIRTSGIGDIGLIDSLKERDIEYSFEKIILNNPNTFFTFVCQTKKDREPMTNFYKSLKSRNVANIDFIENHNPYELKNIYFNQDLVISMRLHASILSISSYTSVIGYTFPEWGFKNEGVLNQFGMLNFNDGGSVVSNFKKIEQITKRKDEISSKIEIYKNKILEILSIFKQKNF